MQNLLDEIESGALDNSVSLISVFKTCLVLARETGSFHLRDWARSELKGYHKSRIWSDDWTPAYRRDIPVVRDYLTESELERSSATLTIIHDVKLLESLAMSTSDMLYHSQPYGTSSQRTGAIRVQTYRKIVEQIRTALAGMVAEVRETPTHEALDRAVAYIRIGDRDAHTQLVPSGRFRKIYRG